MIPRHPTVAAQTWRLAAALALAFAACQRREGVEIRTPLHLGTQEQWSFATHPDLSLSAEQLRSMTSQIFLATGQFVVLPKTEASNAARVALHVMSVDAQPLADKDDEVQLQVRVRVEFVPAGGDENNTLLAVASATARGSRDVAAGSACELAIGRAVQQITSELQGGSKSVDTLVADLQATDPARVAVALERLAAKRHAAAFDPLVRQLRDDDLDTALKALSALVIYNDQRAVRAIIEETERRDFSFQLEAFYALGSIGGEEAEAYLFTIERGHPDPRAQIAAGEALILAQRRSHHAKADASQPGTIR